MKIHEQMAAQTSSKALSSLSLSTTILCFALASSKIFWWSVEFLKTNDQFQFTSL